MELEATWGRTVKIWWSYTWRNILAVVASLIAGGLAGFIIGFIMITAGFNPGVIRPVMLPIGFIMGLGFSVIPMKMILGKDFGEFRLVLVKS